jgi:hypothetical protein
MSSQNGCNLNNLLGEVGDLKQKMEQTLPSHTSLLIDIARLPDEFERRFWVSSAEALLKRVKADYDRYQINAQKAELLGKTFTLMADVVLKMRGMQMIPLPEPIQLGISISPSGKIEIDWLDNPDRGHEEIFIRYKEFVAITQMLKDRLLKGIYSLAAEQ